MSAFVFKALGPPFFRWVGPYSPARGNHCGFRVRSGSLGAWVQNGNGLDFWTVTRNSGARQLVEIVQKHWDGGRVLILPNGFVVKPLQDHENAGVRALIGQCSGPIVFRTSEGETFDISNPGSIGPGDKWKGPNTIGLECLILFDGTMQCRWYHPTRFGTESTDEVLRGADPGLAKGFRAARPHTSSGRVRITACGHVITSRQNGRGEWEPVYVGWVSPKAWSNWKRWIMEERV